MVGAMNIFYIICVVVVVIIVAGYLDFISDWLTRTFRYSRWVPIGGEIWMKHIAVGVFYFEER
jgi:hypothetical protein